MAISDNLRGAIYMNIAMLAFTLGDSCMKAVTQTQPLYQTMLLRGILTTSVLFGLAWATGALRARVGGRDVAMLGWRVVGEIGSTITFFLALMQMPLANLSAVMQFVPLAVTLAAALFLREPLGWRRLSAIFVGFLGVLLIIRPGTSGFDIWSVVGLASVGFVVLRDLSTRKLSRAVPSALVALTASVSVTLMGGVGALFQGWQAVGGWEALLIVAAACNLIIGYLTVVMVMRVGDLGFIAPFRYTALLWAILLGWLAFDTLPDGWTIAGAAIVVATGIFALLRERRLARGRG
ncbi:DMT family transporter [Rhodobacter ferrooxidans]|uniref:EamA domain-containing protein n=1 Tax=Rhodobacter ferrooxidans TaxID=371731 RepID=C8S523_9RHOB|nr:DMT family transporter [Rhodobacter sp. SW2]EEW23888.1 protein of unknown function DUF6, transmembrane [Rhodobacter sp. SW2]